MRLGNPVLNDTLLGQRFAESDTGSGTFTHEFQGILRGSYRAHTMMNTSRPKTRLSDGKAAAFFTQQIAHRDAHILEEYLTMAFVVLITEDHEVTFDCDTGRVLRNKHHTLLFVPVGVIRTGLAHH